MGLFSKKSCSVCGGEIGLLGNRKLEDGNLCKNCAAKLSPWFGERRQSTVEQIKQQLDYRAENLEELKSFHPTLSLGEDTKFIVDEDKAKFVVTAERDIYSANPDILDFSMVTGARLDIDEDADEELREKPDGSEESYNPPRFRFSYDFHVVISLNHPYFNEIRFRLNSSDVETTETAVPTMRKPDPKSCRDYVEYESMGNEIVEILRTGRSGARSAAEAEKAPKLAVVCPYCGASTLPDKNGCCEYCGKPLPRG